MCKEKKKEEEEESRNWQFLRNTNMFGNFIYNYSIVFK